MIADQRSGHPPSGDSFNFLHLDAATCPTGPTVTPAKGPQLTVSCLHRRLVADDATSPRFLRERVVGVDVPCESVSPPARCVS